MPKNKPEKKSLAKLKKEAWKLFSLYIRLKDADWKGNNFCITCGKQYHYKKLQAGHFIPGRHPAVLFNEDLVWPQCWYCNMQMYGNPREYDRFMRQKFGDEKVKEFDLLGRGKKNSLTEGFDEANLTALIVNLKNKLEKLKNKM